MRNRNHVTIIVLLSGTMVLYGTCAEVVGQQRSQRGVSSRGLTPVGSPRSVMGARATRPTNNQSIYRNRANVNTGGPLNFDYTPFLNGPTTLFFDSSALNSAGDASLQGDIGLQSGSPLTGSRPNIRPRLNIADRDAMSSLGVLKQIRDTVTGQLAKCAEKPFSPEWYAAHGSVAPISAEGGNPWSGSSWSDVQALVGVDAAPQRYDFRPDNRGLIFVYRDGVQRERAVDARTPAVQLASTATSAEAEPLGLSLGVFAAVPPVEAPVKSLLHLAISKSGTISGYQYDFATDSMQPLHGALDHASQRAAWQVENAVMEAGIQNLTEDVSRALLFRDDGWTQAWILMRIPESPTAEPAPVKQ
jgi:hypothetical protein